MGRSVNRNEISGIGHIGAFPIPSYDDLLGPVRYSDRSRHGIGGCADHRYRGNARMRHVDLLSIGSYGDATAGALHDNRRRHGAGRRVNHGDKIGAMRHLGVFPIRGNSDSAGIARHRDGWIDDLVGSRVYHRDDVDVGKPYIDALRIRTDG